MSKITEDTQRYESLYEQMLLRAMDIHENNKKRLRAGLILLAAAPLVLLAVRALTDSDKVFFLILWIIFMFADCAYLIGVEYLDDSIQNTLEEVTREEVRFDDLYLRPDQLQERLHEKAAERQELLHERIEERQELLQEKIEARQERAAKRRERRQEILAEINKRRAADTEAAGDEAEGGAGDRDAAVIGGHVEAGGNDTETAIDADTEAAGGEVPEMSAGESGDRS